jgi:hypothetical protein
MKLPYRHRLSGSVKTAVAAFESYLSLVPDDKAARVLLGNAGIRRITTA